MRSAGPSITLRGAMLPTRCAPGSVGVVPDALEPDWTIGRAPGETGTDDRLAWVPYVARESTPGLANALPGVPVLLPLRGADLRVDGGDPELVSGARRDGLPIQVASDEAFGSIVRDESVTTPKVMVDGLGLGQFYWRVQATGPDGLVSAFTGASTFEIAAATAGVTTALAHPFNGAAVLAAAEPDADQETRRAPARPAQGQRDAPARAQRARCTTCLGWRSRRVGRDRPIGQHELRPRIRRHDLGLRVPALPHEQDRIGYEVFKGRLPGPERDLNFGDGLWPAEIEAAVNFALVTANVQGLHYTVPDRSGRRRARRSTPGSRCWWSGRTAGAACTRLS